MSKPDLAGVDAKLARAAEHLNSLNAEVVKYADSRPYVLFNQFHRDYAESDFGECVMLAGTLEEPKPSIGTIYGDLVHNLRSALDHLACRLVELNGKDPGRDTEFPLYSTAKGFREDRAKKIGRMSGDARKLVEKCQPCKRKSDPSAQLLAALHDHWNDDKHKLVHPTLVTIHDSDWGAAEFRVMQDAEIIAEPKLFPGQYLVDNAKVASVRVRATGPKPVVHMERVPSQIAFGAAPSVKLDALPAMAGEVGRVVNIFRPFFD